MRACEAVCERAELLKQNLELKARNAKLRAALEAVVEGGHREECHFACEDSDMCGGGECTCGVEAAQEALK